MKQIIYFRNILSLAVVCLLIAGYSEAATLKGKINGPDKEPLTGAQISILGLQTGTIAGLDGSFHLNDIPVGIHEVHITFIGFKDIIETIEIKQDDETMIKSFLMEAHLQELKEVVVTAHSEKGSDTEARSIEKKAAQTMNVVSAKTIALSPDITVANVIQRVSGLSSERSSNGDPQYAIVRGMDKRYSYTLVNGLKIPSPENKNRYVPLDIFPANLLERLEVYKSLTADQEGDAIAGGINMVMKSAPETFEVKGDLQTGYNYINKIQGFQTYNASAIQKLSPRELYGSDYHAQPLDFTIKNLETQKINPMPDLNGSLSAGSRLFNKRLGLMIGLSGQNSYRGTKSTWFDVATDRFGSNRPALQSMQERNYSTRQFRTGIHGRIDFRINENHKIENYTGVYNLNLFEVRDIRQTMLDGRNYDDKAGNAILAYKTRVKTSYQKIFTTNFQGNHKLAKSFRVHWSIAFSQANMERPDNATFLRNGELKNFIEQPQNIERGNSRRWEHNQDKDITGYLNLMYQPEPWKKTFLKTGMMFRNKNRDNYFNKYTFDPNPSLQLQGKDWNSYSDVQWDLLNPAGSTSDELNYQARENIKACYILGKTEVLNTEINVGVRVENTYQGYTLKSPKENQTADSSQHYTDVLPSLSLKYKISPIQNLRFTYYKAISRPGFFEIVPYQLDDDDYKEAGNPGLKRVKAHNLDLRWEFFPSPSEQILIGGFYKRIKDPIEYALIRSGVNNAPMIVPGNYGTAFNTGIEVDFTKYFNKIGIRGNYTFTHSQINTSKALRTRENPADPTSNLILTNVMQKRTLQGQAKHIANISLLFKDLKNGIEAQLAGIYTGERLEVISPFLDNDMYAKPVFQLDFSLEKKLWKKLEVLLKINNLLNSPYEVYIKKPLYKDEGSTLSYPMQNSSTKTLVRKDQFYQSFRLGVRFEF